MRSSKVPANIGFGAKWLKPLSAMALLAVTGIANAGGEKEAMQRLQDMSKSMQQLSYQGRFVFAHNNQLESMSIIHVNDDMGRRERLISLNGEAREILRDNNNLTCVWPSSRQVVVDQSNQNQWSPIWIPEDVTRLNKFYQFSMAGKDRVADHPAIVVMIKPRDGYRYGMKVWIHENHSLMLQSALFDDQGKLAEQIMFTDLKLLDENEQQQLTVTPQIDNSYALIRSHTGEQVTQTGVESNWRLQFLPGGFWLDSKLSKPMNNAEHKLQQMVLTDGLASVSVFIEPTSDQSLQGASSMGAVNAFGTRFNDYTVTAIGEVPAKTVKQIAESVVYLN